MKSFNELGIEQDFVEKLKQKAITSPTEIQSLVIPNLLAGCSTVFRSETGTGKTFAYLLPALQNIATAENKQGLLVLICAPTLELCSQIKTEVDFLSPYPASQAVLLIGSGSIDKQIESIKRNKPVIAIGNPGRLFALAKMGKIKLNNLQYLILDEADRLTAQDCFEDTKGLLDIIEKTVKRNEDKNITALACSATTGKKTSVKLGTLYENAEIIESTNNEILRERIEHWAIFSEKRRKVQTLRSLISALKGKNAKSNKKILIFTSKNDEAAAILSKLQFHHISALGLFGKVNGKPQTGEQRKAALDLFREGKVDVLISTDLAARGLDITGIGYVIALDVPEDGEVYIHRCGRTGRAGKRGIMITVGDETQMQLLALLEKKLKIRVNPKELYEGHIHSCDEIS